MSRDESSRRREPGVSQELPDRYEDGAESPPEGAEVESPPWDADDARRKEDNFAPPEVPCECWCMHCRRTFSSEDIWFQRVINDPKGFAGFWMCPTPNCSGAGFTFDIFPTDPDHPANDGWSYDDDEEETDDEETDDEEDESFDDGDAAGGEWDPAEPEYKALDEALEEDDDIEGEEWKYGLAPGERPAEPEWLRRARQEREDEERRYDQPDERPRVIDWKDREERETPGFTDDDIPF